MRFLVTGGAGFIGSRLVSKLLLYQHKVRVLDNFSTGRRDRLPENVDLIEGDVNDVAARAVEDVDVVYHLAAIPWVQYAIDHPRESWRANAEGTLAILKAAAESGVHRLVFASSCAVYGDDQNMQPLSSYGKAKLRSEEYCDEWASPTFEIVKLRFFNVYSHDEEAGSVYSRVIPLFIKQAVARQPITVNGDGLQTRDFVHIQDVIASLIAAGYKAGISGKAMDIATGTPISILDLARFVCSLAGVEPNIVHQPALPGEMRFVHSNPMDMMQKLGVRNPISILDGLSKIFPRNKPSA